mmetsp:Transcript_175058/g.561394  ORF Transcript_175058/g.561394 Transcript_175058/m.561394 type:complete len:402 (-) Transcript_175058:255-1460(-)
MTSPESFVGARVELVGLVAKTELNGRIGRVLHYDEPSERVPVTLELLPVEAAVTSPWAARQSIRKKQANLVVVAELEFAPAPEDDDVSDRCYLCLNTMPPVTWRGDEQILHPCCGVAICKGCGEVCTRRRVAALALIARANRMRETDPNWEEALAPMLHQVIDATNLLERDETCDMCRRAVPTTPEQSFSSCLENAQAGKPRACYLVGNKYDIGLGVRRDLDEAHRWLERAATHPQPHPNAVTALGTSHLKRRNYTEALRWLSTAAAVGNANATTNLGMMYEQGLGIDRSAAKAAEWYERGAEAGSHSAQTSVGRCYLDGAGVPRSFEKAHHWLLSAAQQGNAVAQHSLTCCLLTMAQGKSEAKQRVAFRSAMEWSRRAAAQGAADAAVMLRSLEAHPMNR